MFKEQYIIEDVHTSCVLYVNDSKYIHELFREQHVLLETVILSIEMATFLFLPLIFVVFVGTFLHRTANKTAPKSNNRSNTIIPHVLLIFERGKTKYLITYEVFKGLGIQQLSPWTWNDFTEDAFFFTGKGGIGNKPSTNDVGISTYTSGMIKTTIFGGSKCYVGGRDCVLLAWRERNENLTHFRLDRLFFWDIFVFIKWYREEPSLFWRSYSGYTSFTGVPHWPIWDQWPPTLTFWPCLEIHTVQRIAFTTTAAAASKLLFLK